MNDDQTEKIYNEMVLIDFKISSTITKQLNFKEVSKDKL